MLSTVGQLKTIYIYIRVVVEMKILKWMGDRTRKERIIIENIRVKLEISLIEDKMSKNRLR